MKLFLPILALFVQYVCGYVLTHENQAFCTPIRHEKLGKAFIDVISRGAKAPIVIFHATDIVDLKLPPPEQYDPKSADLGAIDDSRDNMFKGEVSPKKSTHFEVKKSGLYCIYTACEDDNAQFVVNTKNSYGYLGFMEYIEYKQSFYGNIIMIIVLVVLFRSLIASIGKDFLNLNRVSTVSKCSIMYILLPGILVGLLKQLSGFIANRSNNIIALGFRDIVNCLASGYSSIINYIILMFCMGYGVLYDDKSGFRPMNSFNSGLCLGLLCLDLFLIVMSTFFSSDSSANSAFLELKPGLFSSLLMMSQVVWFILSVYYGLSTHRSMKEFPPYGTNVEDYGLKNERITKKFKQSLYLIFLVPVYSGISGLVVAGILKDKPLPPVDLPEEYEALFLNDLMIENKGVLVFQTWNQFFIGLLIVVGIYYIWVREDLSELVSPSDRDQEADLETI